MSFKIPHRHHIGVSNGTVYRLVQHPVFHRIERIDTAVAPARETLHPAVLRQLILLL